MIKVLIRLRFVPTTKKFEFVVGDKTHNLTTEQTHNMIRDARRQLLDVTDAQMLFCLKFAKNTVQFNGAFSRGFFEELVEYLETVWTSWKQYSDR